MISFIDDIKKMHIANRHYGIDALRVICSIAVVLIHIVTAPVSAAKTVIDGQVLHRLNVIHNMLNWSVPCFFIITGFCMLAKDECSYRYCLSHIKKYILCLMTIGFVQALLECIYIERQISLNAKVYAAANVIAGNLWDHMWFVYSIIGIYLVLPVLHTFINTSKESAWILTGILFVFSVLFPFIERWLCVGVHLPFGKYLFYVCVGGIIARYSLSNKSKLICYILGFISIFRVILGRFESVLTYTDPSICLMAVALFVLFSEKKNGKFRVVHTLAKDAWGMYLLHPFVINLVLKFMSIDVLTAFPFMRLFIFAVGTISVTYGMIFVLRKIPVIKRIL